MKERGITLIALIISVIILIILATISIKIIYDTKMIEVTVNGTKDYLDMAIKEQKEFNEASDYIDKEKNRKPYINVNVKAKTSESVTIIARGTDEDKEKLEYTLYIGNTKENMTRQEQVKIEQEGSEVEWTIFGLSDNTKYYYKVEVKDKYEIISSEVKEVITNRINSAPVLETINIEKTTNSITIKALATDGDEDKLIYTLWLGENKENLIKQDQKIDINQGIEIMFEKTGLEEYTEYYYRMDVEDGIEVTEGIIQNVKTYCSGKGSTCARW